MKYELSKNSFLFYTLLGSNSGSFSALMHANKREKFDMEKFFNFYHYGGNTISETESALGLDIREVMTCASKLSPAVTYHRNYGLILSGTVKAIFDGDTGLVMTGEGEYPLQQHYKTANQVDLQTLMTTWYAEFEKATNFIWNEVILEKGSKIVGAFHDLNKKPTSTFIGYHETYSQDKQYCLFMEKVSSLGLEIVEINSK